MQKKRDRYSSFTVWDKYSTFFLICVMLFFHIVSFALGFFFVHRFLILDYDPLVIVLLLMFPGMVIAYDIAFRRHRIYRRLMLRCKISNEGIHCSGLGWKAWNMPWGKIKVYGISGYDTKYQSDGILFFSMDASERYDKKHITDISYSRVIFVMRKDIFNAVSQYAPEDMKKRLADSVRNKQSCFIRRH